MGRDVAVVVRVDTIGLYLFVMDNSLHLTILKLIVAIHLTSCANLSGPGPELCGRRLSLSDDTHRSHLQKTLRLKWNSLQCH